MKRVGLFCLCYDSVPRIFGGQDKEEVYVEKGH